MHTPAGEIILSTRRALLDEFIRVGIILKSESSLGGVLVGLELDKRALAKILIENSFLRLGKQDKIIEVLEKRSR